ncbi:MAG: hypothetical protein ABWX70_10600 [Hyphomicrobium sp.]
MFLLGTLLWGGLVALVVMWRRWTEKFKQPLSITAIPQGVMVGETFYPREDIVEVYVHAPSIPPATGSSVALVGGGLAGALGGAMVQGVLNGSRTIAANARIHAFGVYLRRRSVSIPIKLGQGPTEQTSTALVNDIFQIIR